MIADDPMFALVEDFADDLQKHEFQSLLELLTKQMESKTLVFASNSIEILKASKQVIIVDSFGILVGSGSLRELQE